MRLYRSHFIYNSKTSCHSELSGWMGRIRPQCKGVGAFGTNRIRLWVHLALSADLRGFGLTKEGLNESPQVLKGRMGVRPHTEEAL